MANTQAPQYLIDTNILLYAEQFYGFDLCPTLWDWFLQLNQAGRFIIIQQVRDEIISANQFHKNEAERFERSRLEQWVGELSTLSILDMNDSRLAHHFKAISQWVQENPQHSAMAKHNFLNSADYPLVVYAVAFGFTIVTNEKDMQPTSGNSRNLIGNIKIPYACRHFNAKFLSMKSWLGYENKLLALMDRN